MSTVPTSGHYDHLFGTGDYAIKRYEFFRNVNQHSVLSDHAFAYADLAFTVETPIFSVYQGSWDLSNQHDGSVTILNKTKDGSTIITNASDYKGVSVTVKDYLPTYDANGAITPNGFAMQFAFIFDNGKQYLVRLHNTDSNSPNYKLQNMGGTNCLTGWKWQADLNAAQKKNLLEGDGVKITVMLEGPNAVLYADGQKKATVPLGEEYAGKLVQIQLCMNGNKTGGNIEIPFELIKASEEHIHTPATAVVENKTDATCGADGSYDEVVKCECGHEISRTPKVIPATGAHIYDEGVVTKEPTYTETGVKTYTCGTCGDTKTEDIPMLEKIVVDTKFTGKSLALEGAVTINLYVTYTVDGVTMNEDFVEANAGVLYWSVEDMPADRDAAILGTETHKADVKCAGVYQGDTEFFAMSHGIPAKCYGDTVYFRTYILVDGEYQYGEVEEYSILAYCENVFKNQNKPKLESALVALLNYGSAAQTYFAKNGETPVLVNAGLETYLEDGWITADMLELSAADKVQTPLKGASAEMTVNFAQSGVMGGTSKSLALEGAIATNYYVAVTDHEVLANAQSEKAYFWTEAKYNELQAAGIPLSKENASYVVDAQLTYSTRYGYEYFVASEQVPAPEWGNTQYMATVITDANGVDHCSGVITYSPLEYAAYLLNNGVANREDPVCEWLIAYSHRAIIALGR